jgi:hypothetical protein
MLDRAVSKPILNGPSIVAGVVSSDLTDEDWAEINRLRRAYERGTRAFDIALEKLAADPIRYAVVIAAFFPDMVRETIRDQIAEMGMTADDVRELIRKVESHGRPH